MDVEAFVDEPGLGSVSSTGERRDGEHFEIAGKDHVGAGENGGETTGRHQGSGDRQEASCEPAVIGAPQIDRGDALDVTDGLGAASKADRGDRGSASHQHAHAPVHSRIGKIVHEVSNSSWACRRGLHLLLACEALPSSECIAFRQIRHLRPSQIRH